MTPESAYERKRDFRKTPEPRASGEGERRFVIHRHGASSDHYDLRLQVGEGLRSWAVPKGPSTDPRERRLALLTKDHPLESGLVDMPGARIERKRCTVAAHWRQVPDDDVGDVEDVVDEVVGEVDGLRKGRGKRVFELRPDIDWDKGKAVGFVAEHVARDGWAAVYIGDDVTDEDAFRAIRGRGAGIVVRGEDDRRSTAAAYRLDDPDAVRRFLMELVKAHDRRGENG